MEGRLVVDSSWKGSLQHHRKEARSLWDGPILKEDYSNIRELVGNNHVTFVGVIHVKDTSSHEFSTLGSKRKRRCAKI
jgi:hypothetical protein